ncbi:MAG TPA: signal peptidase I [Actinomycetota bacterium]
MSAIAVAAAGRRFTGRRIASAALWTVGGVAFGICMAVTLPLLLGLKSLTVLSGSMSPTIQVGDIVVVKQMSALEARVGDVVTFREPSDPGRLITHRVRKISVADGVVSFETKGDANTSVEEWTVASGGSIGVVLYRVPKLGYVLFHVRGPFGRLLLVVLPALLLGGYELWRIWRPEPTTTAEATDAA